MLRAVKLNNIQQRGDKSNGNAKTTHSIKAYESGMVRVFRNLGFGFCQLRHGFREEFLCVQLKACIARKVLFRTLQPLCQRLRFEADTALPKLFPPAIEHTANANQNQPKKRLNVSLTGNSAAPT